MEKHCEYFTKPGNLIVAVCTEAVLSFKAFVILPKHRTFIGSEAGLGYAAKARLQLIMTYACPV